MHWDHIGDPDRIPSKSIVLGGESRELLADPYPPNINSRFLALPAGRPLLYVDFHDNESALRPFGPFEHAVDFHGDGSLYLVDAPGHVLGHMLAAVRVGPDAFVLLSGDTCHSRQCYCGEPPRTICKGMYADWDVARETAGRLARVQNELPNVLVCLAHEKEREEEMPLFPASINEWAVKEVERRKAQDQTR